MSPERGANPRERLRTGLRHNLLTDELLPFGPLRLEKGSGTYPNARDLVSGLLHEFSNDVEMVVHLLTKSKWIELCDPDFDLLELISSLINNPPKGAPCTIGKVIHLCTTVGNSKGKAKWPGWALPPKVASEEEEKKETDLLAELCNKANLCRDPNRMALLLRSAYRDFGLTEMAFNNLRIRNYFEKFGEAKVRSGTEVKQRARKDNNSADVIEGFLQRNVGILVGGSNSGKTALCSADQQGAGRASPRHWRHTPWRPKERFCGSQATVQTPA